MATKIKVRGAKSAPKQDEAKAKPTPRKRTASKSQTATPAKRGPGRPRKSEATAPAARRNRTSGIDAKEEAKLVKHVSKAGDRRRAAEEEHKESVNALHEAAKHALASGVSMAKVAQASGISRQWLYKMGDFAQRGAPLRAGNGNGESNGKSEAKAVKRPAAPAKRVSSKATPKSTDKKRVRIRS